MRCVTPECDDSEVMLNCTCVPRQTKVNLVLSLKLPVNHTKTPPFYFRIKFEIKI